MAEAGRIHVVGAGLAGLSAAVASTHRGAQIVVYEAAKQAGGRCRSYHDSLLDLVIDNGNHLVLSGNQAVRRYLRAIGAEDRLAGSPHPEFGFFDVGTGHRWTVRPSDGRFPWWILSRARRVPGTRLRDYVALVSLMRRHPGRRIDEVIPCDGVFWDKFLRPVLVSALNTAPEEAAADLAGAVMRETLAKGGRFSRPLLATPNLTAAFIDPALNHLKRNGAEIQFGRLLRAVTLEGDRLTKLMFDDGEETLGPQDSAILAVPPWALQTLLPQVPVPDAFRAIVNAHFRVEPPARAPRVLGLVGGTAEWIFAFADRISTTTSAADHLLEMDTDALGALLWRDVTAAHGLQTPVPPFRIVKEKRATFASTPAQEARRPSARSSWTNLFLAGDWTNTGLPATIEGALRSGEAASKLALASR
jgi:squalene-associated FAD-dependent desaturase